MHGAKTLTAFHLLQGAITHVIATNFELKREQCEKKAITPRNEHIGLTEGLLQLPLFWHGFVPISYGTAPYMLQKGELWLYCTVILQ